MKVSLKQVLLMTLAVMIPFAGNAYAGDTYDSVIRDKTVNVGLMYNSIPAAFFNEKNEWVGFDIDIATEVVKRIGEGMEIKLALNKVKVNNKTRISFLTSNRIDLSVANMTHKRERDKTIDFSITYFFDGQKIMTKKGKYKDPKELVGKRVCAMQGTTSEKNLMNLLKGLGDPDAEKNVISFQTAPDCFLALAQGKVEAWSTDSTILLGFAAKQAGKFELIGDFISDEPYGMGLPEDDSKWRDCVNFAIQDIWADGTYMKIYDKWYGADTPFSFPMTSSIEMWP